MDFKEIESSNIHSYGFVPNDPLNSDLGTLVMRFKNGSEYRFENVPAYLIAEMDEAESCGKFFSSYIRGHFESVKYEPETEADDDEG